MLRTFLVVMVVLAITVGSLYSQSAIGLRFGGIDGAFGGELIYERAMGDNRLSLGLGADFASEKSGGIETSSTYLNFFGSYQWVFDLNDEMRWYAGPGLSLNFYTWEVKSPYFKADDSVFMMGAGGAVGIERDFGNLTIGFDARPIYRFMGEYEYQPEFRFGDTVIKSPPVTVDLTGFFLSYGLVLKYRF